MRTYANAMLVRFSFATAVLFVALLWSADGVAQTFWEPGRNVVKLNIDTDGSTQRLSFRRGPNSGDTEVAIFASGLDNVAIQSIAISNIAAAASLGNVTVVPVGQTCVDVTAEFAPGDWNGGILAFDVTAIDQFGVMDQPAAFRVTSVQGASAFPSVADCSEAAPVANIDNFTGGNAIAEDSPATALDVLANDGPQVPASSLTITGLDTSTAPGVGQFVNNGSSILYTPASNFSGSFSFTYTMSGGNFSSSSPGVVNVEVVAANDPPVANGDSDVTAVNQSVTIDVLGNDTDGDPTDTLVVTAVTQGGNGATVVNNGTDVTYAPASGFTGLDTFTYTISDGNGGTDTATVTVDVGGVNSPPTAVNDTATTTQDVAVNIDVLVNDSDIDGDSISVSAVANGASGIAVNNGTDVTYTPNPGFFGSDTFTYTITDGVLTDTATITVTVQQVNDVPVAQNDTATTQQGTPITINVLGNDSDPEGDVLTVAGVTQPANGSVVNNTANVAYTPNAGFFGDDTFTYDVSDGQFTSTATVTVTVQQRFLLESIAETPNQLSVARTVDNVCPRLGQMAQDLKGDENDLLAKCSNLIGNQSDPDAQRQGLDEISGREISAQQTTGIDFSQIQLTNVSSRMQALRQGMRGTNFAGLQLYHEGQYIPASQLASMAKDLTGGGSGDEEESAQLQSRWGFFGRGKINIGEKDGTENEAGFDFDSWGVTLGVDYRFTDNFVLGIAGGFNTGETKFDAEGGGVDSDGNSAHVFGVFYGENAYFDFVGSFGKLDYDSVRNINYTDASGVVNETAVGSTEGDMTAVGVSFGYEFNRGGWGFTPNVSASSIEVDIDPFSESGAAGLNMSFDKQNAKSTLVEGGLKVSYVASRNWGVIIPELRVSFVKELDNNSEVLNVRFLNDPFANDSSQASPGIKIVTDAPDDSYLRWGLALNAQLKSGFSGFVDYETLSGLNLITSHEFTFGLRFQRQFR